MSTKMLLVEGVSDKDFFAAYCKDVGLSDIKVYPPKELNPAAGNGWSNLLNNLDIALKDLSNTSLTHLAIVLDADYPPHNNGGYQQRLGKISEKLAEYGYTLQPSSEDGSWFEHHDGLNPIGLWIMPNHQNDGMLEDFIAGLISDTKQVDLLQFADKTLAELPHTLFDPKLHLTKAKVATWRAWQKTPSSSLDKVLRDGLLDRTKAAQFENWLTKVLT